MRSSSARVVLALLALGIGLGACSTEGLAFRVDDRVEIVAPDDRAEVRLPVTIAWTVEGFDVTGPTEDVRADAGYFAVLVDRAPPAPGELVTSLLDDDEVCAARPGCPDAAYLAEHDVYVTRERSITVTRLPDEGGSAGGDLHEATVVLVDGQGHRIGESAFPVQFRLEDP